LGTQTHLSGFFLNTIFMPSPHDESGGLNPISAVGGVDSRLGETVNPLSPASLSKTSNDPKFNLAPYPMLID